MDITDLAEKMRGVYDGRINIEDKVANGLSKARELTWKKSGSIIMKFLNSYLQFK